MKTVSAHRLILIQLRMALLCVVLAVLGGAAGVLHYLPELSPRLNEWGLGLAKLRPVHTSFASVWIFGAAVAVVYHFLSTSGGGLTRGDGIRFRVHTVCWLAAGVGILVTLLLGVTSGREYLGFHPLFSILLLLGWVMFAISFLKRSLPGFFKQPVYLWFWTVGVLYFIYTFIEGHAYLLPKVGDHPVRDLQIQWKSCGTLVGSFNFMVYGCLFYVTERMSDDKSYGQSKLAFLLFGVGCLNSFTNYAHHTYHLPQSHAVKWIAFVVSMAEVLILLRLIIDLRRMLKRKLGAAPYSTALACLTAAKWWTAAILFSSVLISIPNLNSIIHGTKVVIGHAMGAELGIDTMILFGAVAFLLGELGGRRSPATQRLNQPRQRLLLLTMNLSMAALILWLTVSGAAHGYYRYNGLPNPEWIGYERVLFPLLGGLVSVSLLAVVLGFSPLLFQRAASALVEPVSPEPEVESATP